MNTNYDTMMETLFWMLVCLFAGCVLTDQLRAFRAWLREQHNKRRWRQEQASVAQWETAQIPPKQSLMWDEVNAILAEIEERNREVEWQ